MHEVLTGSLVEFGQQTIRRQPLMPVPLDGRSLRAPQHLADMPDPEPFTDASHAGDDLLGRHMAVGQVLRFTQANVAATTVRLLIGLAEVFRKRRMAAAGSLRVPPHLVKMLQLSGNEPLGLLLVEL